MTTNLTRIGEKARKKPDLVFTSLYHHIYDVDNLRACYDSLEAKKATGLDCQRIRAANHVSQAVFAAILGIGKSTVQQWEQGQKNQVAPHNVFSVSLIERAWPHLAKWWIIMKFQRGRCGT